ncbi:hypothetical protein NL676_039001 [Syzygium grande]|nr:hypothetical protein NL676_039001 [Syzygium grande]
MASAGEQAQASSGGGVGYHLFPTVAELDEQVQAIRAKIEGAGIRPLPFSVADINGISLTTRTFFKYAKAFTNIANIKDEAQKSQKQKQNCL